MPNYKNSKIYSIRSHQTDNIYIGSTTQRLSQRLYEHRKTYKKKTKYHYFSSFEILKYDDAYIELIENYPCDNREQLGKREGFYIRKFKKQNICVNKYLAGRTAKEWAKDNKAQKLKYMKKYYEKNKEKIKEKRIIYNSGKKILCKCGSLHRRDGKSKHLRTKKHIEFMNDFFDNIFENFNNNPIF